MNENIENKNKNKMKIPIAIVLFIVILFIIGVIGMALKSENNKYAKEHYSDILNRENTFNDNKTINNHPSINQLTTVEIPKDWNVYKIGNIGEITIPPTLELRNKNSKYALLFKKAADDYFEIQLERNYGHFDLVFQPKGINEAETESSIMDATSKYARVLIKYEKGEKGDFFHYNEKITDAELKDGNEEIKSRYFEDARKMSKKIIQWEDAKSGTINGILFIAIGYIREGLNNNNVKVKEYYFYNSDELMNIIISYRMSESDIWADDFSKIASTFKFNTKK
jgi:hypothetical protein